MKQRRQGKFRRRDRRRPPRRFVAVDFDSRQVRFVRSDRIGAVPRLKHFHQVDLPEDLDATDPVAIGRQIGKHLQTNHLRRLPVIMNVPRGQAVLKPLTLPPGTRADEIAGMVQFQVTSDLPFPAEEGVLDFTVESDLQNAQQAVAVLASAVRNDVIDYYTRLADAAGIRLCRLGLRPYANARCLQACGVQQPGDVLAIVHVTHDETEIDIMDADVLTFSRASTASRPSEPAPGDQGQDRLDTMISDIQRSLQGYLAVEEDRQISRILVAGSTGVEGEIAHRLADLQGVPVRLFNPADHLRIREPANASPYISAIGLAYGSRGRGNVPFDFLNPKQPVRKADPRDQRRKAIALAGMIGLFIAIVGSWFYLDAKEDRVNALKAAKNQQQKKEKQLTQLIRRVELVEAWAQKRVRWLDHWALLSSVMPPAGDAYIDELDTGKETITFVVRARDSEIIERLIQDLQAVGYKPKTSKDGLNEDNPFGYVRHTEVEILLPDHMDFDLASRSVPPRPPDDDLAAPLDEIRNQSDLVETASTESDVSASTTQPAPAEATGESQEAGP